MEKRRQTVEISHNHRTLAIGVGTVVIALCAGTVGWQLNQHETAHTPEIGQQSIEYPTHHNIRATVFWAGETADGSNDYIPNHASAWASDWVAMYGGVDNPENRCGYSPCALTPKENPFYFALPFSDYTENGPKSPSELTVIPWFTGSLTNGKSVLKNHWIEVTYGDKKAYAQWEDVGPFEENDPGYVFGNNSPHEPRAGLDMSPGLADYLHVDGSGDVSWRFVNDTQVPDGPWKKTVTRSDPNFN